jgi:hypothetical protein
MQGLDLMSGLHKLDFSRRFDFAIFSQQMLQGLTLPAMARIESSSANRLQIDLKRHRILDTSWSDRAQTSEIVTR